jgi:hypothetical protein
MSAEGYREFAEESLELSELAIQLAIDVDEDFRDPGKLPCPDCGARVGDYCVTSTGERTGDHSIRRRLAKYKPVEER